MVELSAVNRAVMGSSPIVPAIVTMSTSLKGTYIGKSRVAGRPRSIKSYRETQYRPCTRIRAIIGSPRETRKSPHAGVAQLVERLPCKQDVAGSIPVISSIFGEMSERPKVVAWKATVRAIVPQVRILFSPPFTLSLEYILKLLK